MVPVLQPRELQVDLGRVFLNPHQGATPSTLASPALNDDVGPRNKEVDDHRPVQVGKDRVGLVLDTKALEKLLDRLLLLREGDQGLYPALPFRRHFSQNNKRTTLMSTTKVLSSALFQTST